MIRTHPLFQPVMGLAPFLGLKWKTGDQNGTLWESGHPLSHQQADLSPTPLKCDAITDNHTLFSVGYGVGKVFEDDCFEPCDIENLKLEATAIHLHQLCTFIATDIDPLPFADPMVVIDPSGLSQYLAQQLRKPVGNTKAAEAVKALLHYFQK